MIDFEARKPEMIALLKRLVESESPSHDKAAVDRVGKIVADEGRRLGADVEVGKNASSGNHVLADFHPHPHPPSLRERQGLPPLPLGPASPPGGPAKKAFHQKAAKNFGARGLRFE